ncbi:TetR/AcrR family transcriptional regulator [Pseudomonas delhiensis]|uniref:TetR/AcrR family transcriptional regulator n=1 Tax=Pseudomonas delhiensis TaxID=366289 RepID=UPI003159D327
MSDQATRPARTPANRRNASVDDSEPLGIRERNQRLILGAASQEFAAKGFQAARTEDIAARVGLPKANVYYYFQNKRNLYARVLETLVEPLLQAAALLRAELPPEQALPAYIQARMRVAHEHPHTYKAVLGEMLLPGNCRPPVANACARPRRTTSPACAAGWNAA